MLNNQGSESKYNVTIPLDGVAGIKNGSGLSCHAETQLRIEIVGVNPSNTIDIEGRIRNSPNWYVITTATGAITGTVDISTYDFIRYNVTTPDGSGVIYASGFIFNISSGGGGGGAGDASAANQVAGNAILTLINNKTPGNLLANKLYDNIQMSYTSTTDVFSYYNGVTLTATTTITYTDSTKSVVSSVQRV